MMASSFKRKRDATFRSSHNASSSRRSRPRRDEETPLFPDRGASNGIPSFASSPSTPRVHQQRTAVNAASGQDRHPDLQRDLDDNLDQVVMAIDIKERGTVGCCYYTAQKEKFYILGDIRSGGTEAVETLRLAVKPTVVLTSTRAEHLITLGQQELREGDDAQFRLPYQVDIRPSQEFSYTSAKNKLVALEMSSERNEHIQFLVPGDGLTYDDQVGTENVGFTAHEGKILHLAGFIDMENTISVGCAGALLTYLQRKRATEYLPNDDSVHAFRVRSIEMFTLQGTMFINADTLSSLQILQSESHPNAFNQGPGRTSPGSKESLSIYGLFHHLARTPQGKARLRQHFFRPSVNLKVIRERHDFIGVFLRPDNVPALEKMVAGLKQIKNLRPVMINLRKGVSTGSGKITGFKTTVWGTLLAFAFYGIDVQEALREVIGGESLNLRTEALKILDAVGLRRLGAMIHEIVDIDSSEEQHRTVVKPGINRELDMLKDRYNGLDSLLKQVAIDIAASIPEELDIDINVIYFPQLGFNIAIPLDQTGRAAYDGDVEAWELMFVTENRAYFKDFRMREMDDKLGDMYGLICDKEIEIVYELAQKVLQYEEIIVEASDICGELDSLLAMAQGACLYKLVRPEMTEENVIRIKGGRHLLQELAVPSYVPNDTFLIGGRGDRTTEIDRETSDDSSYTVDAPHGPSMLLLTGPNYSGKSVYMKQVALIVYLAHIGSFVPAESAEIGVTDKILTRINTRETVSKAQSTFMIDLQQISLALNLATNRSLLIVDEFGKGTDCSDGAGLACGIFEYLLNLGDNRPKVVAATHFHEIFENGFLEPRPELQFGHMEVQVDERSREIGDQITYLYNFLPGRSNESFGTICAGMNGIDQAIIARANEIATLSARAENLVAACAKMSAEETEALEEAEAIARNFLELDLSKTAGQKVTAKRIRDILDALLEPATSSSC